MNEISVLIGFMIGVLVTIAYNVIKIRILIEMRE